MDRREFLRVTGSAGALLSLPHVAFTEEKKMKTLKGLRSVPIHDDNLHLACIKGSLDFLGIDVSAPWLAGGTGHAFIIRITPGVCLGDVDSALQASYRDGTMAKLGKNLGYELDYRFIDKRAETFQVDREKAWGDLRAAIDSGHPCYIYYNFCNQMIGGYDENGLYFAKNSFPKANSGQGPIPLPQKDGFELTIIRPAKHKADDVTIVKDGILFALAHPKMDPANHGLAAYDNWIESIRTREETGTWRSIRAWHTCRSLGVDFLSEAKQRIGGGTGVLFEAARKHYEVVAGNLKLIAERSAAAKTDKVDPIDRDLTVAQLTAAREAEEKGIEALKRITAAL